MLIKKRKKDLTVSDDSEVVIYLGQPTSRAFEGVRLVIQKRKQDLKTIYKNWQKNYFKN